MLGVSASLKRVDACILTIMHAQITYLNTLLCSLAQDAS